MRLLVILSSVLLLIFSINVPVFANEQKIDQARIKAAKNLMMVTGAAKTFDPMMGLMGKQLTQMMVQQNPSKGPQISKLMGAILAEMSVRKAELINLAAGVYARQFTVDEMNEISAFYGTPVGLKMVAKLPVIMQESMQIGQVWGQKLATEIIRRFQEEAKKQGLKL